MTQEEYLESLNLDGIKMFRGQPYGWTWELAMMIDALPVPHPEKLRLWQIYRQSNENVAPHSAATFARAVAVGHKNQT